MKKGIFIVQLVLVLTFFLTVESYSQPGTGTGRGGGWGRNSQYGRLYNPATIETVKGSVVSVDKMTPTGCMNYGIRLMLKTDKETIPVHLGPEWYISKQDMKFKAQDALTVKGSKITYEGKPVIIAAEIKKGDKTLVLRDEKGFPNWSGWKRQS